MSDDPNKNTVENEDIYLPESSSEEENLPENEDDDQDFLNDDEENEEDIDEATYEAIDPTADLEDDENDDLQEEDEDLGTDGEDDEDDKEDEGSAPENDAPLIPPCYVRAAQGDCVLSLAARFALAPSAIWDAPENQQLKQTRKINVLQPGDQVFIPKVERQWVRSSTGKAHRFVVQVPTYKLKFRFRKGGSPRADIDYTLKIDGLEYTGKLDGEGALEVGIPQNARNGKVILHDPQGEEQFPIRMGHLNPVEDVAGAQTRLKHLGFHCGAVDGVVGKRTRAALRAFQKKNNLEASGELDAATQAKLVEIHGS